jgi:hypothetical protein
MLFVTGANESFSEKCYEDRLTALAMVSMEKRLVSSIKDFNMKVIEKFASKKNRRMDLNFRH